MGAFFTVNAPTVAQARLPSNRRDVHTQPPHAPALSAVNPTLVVHFLKIYWKFRQFSWHPAAIPRSSRIMRGMVSSHPATIPRIFAGWGRARDGLRPSEPSRARDDTIPHKKGHHPATIPQPSRNHPAGAEGVPDKGCCVSILEKSPSGGLLARP